MASSSSAGSSQEQVQKALEQQMMGAAKMVEDKLDSELERLDKMTEDDLDQLRAKRLDDMKKMQKLRQEWLAKGHGQYSELKDEGDFFKACKNSKRLVVHFYRDSTFRCKIVDKHFNILAGQHVETRFCKIDAERSKFLTDRLKVRVLPTICLVRDGKTVDYIVGFDDLGGHDEFSTEMMEWRLAQADIVNYSGDLTTPPDDPTRKPKTSITFQGKSSIRQGGNSDDSDDE